MFSVIIPVHNNEPHLERSIGSVLNQTYSDFELILVDDASKDLSYQKILTFEDPRIKVFRRDQPGPGGYAARNLGINEASREWISFLDADDEWMPTHLEEKRILIGNNSESKVFSCGWVDSFDTANRESCKAFKKYADNGSQKFEFLGYVRESTSAVSLINTNVITVKKTLIQSLGGFPEGKCRRGGDVTTYMNLILKSNSLVWGAFLGAVYHKEDSYITKTIRPEINKNCIQIEVSRLLNEGYSSEIKAGLKRVSNFHLTFGLIVSSQAGELTRADMDFYFRDSNAQYFLLYILSLLPGNLQKVVWSIYHKVR